MPPRCRCGPQWSSRPTVCLPCCVALMPVIMPQSATSASFSSPSSVRCRAWPAPRSSPRSCRADARSHRSPAVLSRPAASLCSVQSGLRAAPARDVGSSDQLAEQAPLAAVAIAPRACPARSRHRAASSFARACPRSESIAPALIRLSITRRLIACMIGVLAELVDRRETPHFRRAL